MMISMGHVTCPVSFSFRVQLRIQTSSYRDEDQIILNKNHGLLYLYPVDYRRYLKETK